MTRYKLSEICKIVSGSTPKTNVPEYWDGENVWITPAEITDKTFIVYDSQRKLSNLGVEKTHLSSFPKGTVILSSRAPIGKVAIAGVEMFCNQGFKNLICSEKIMNEYLYWFLKGKTKYLNSLGRGATFKELSAKIIGNIELEVPSIQEQKEVVIRLRKIDQIIGVFEREVELLDELIKARFVEMFGDPITNDMLWNTVKLNDVCYGIGDGLHGTPEYDEYGDYPFINGNNLKNGMIEITPSTKMVNEDIYRKYFIKLTENTILLSINGTLGNLALYNGEKVVLGKSACYCNLIPDINRIFVCSVMKTDAFSNFLESNATSSTIKNIGLKVIREFELIVPPLELQNQFASFVQEIDKSRSRIQKSLEASQELFDSLMQEYFG